jgi:toxin HigB-1
LQRGHYRKRVHLSPAGKPNPVVNWKTTKGHRNFVHKGLKKLYADDVAKGVPPDAVDKLRKMLAFLDDMEDPKELRALPSWRVHTLTGDRKGTWSLSVTANRRLTFRIDTGEQEIYDANVGDYH